MVRRFAGDDAQQVVVIGGLAAPRRARPGGRRVRAAEPGAAPVDVTRATVVTADRLADEAAAEAWLAAAAGPRADATRTGALAVLNRALHARRIAAAEPLGREVAATAAAITRVGYGTGEEVSDGAWTAARDLPGATPRIRREAALRPQERFAALLAGRDAALACELLALRARADLDHGRDREAALQLEAALAAGRAELAGWLEVDGMAARLDELAGLADEVAGAAARARAGGLDDVSRSVVGRALGRLEAALRARTAAARL